MVGSSRAAGAAGAGCGEECWTGLNEADGSEVRDRLEDGDGTATGCGGRED